MSGAEIQKRELIEMADDDDDKSHVYDLIEFIASREQIGTKTVMIKGSLTGFSEAQCAIGSGNHVVYFDSGDLPEDDREKLIESGSDGKPVLQGTVSIDCGNMRAKKVQFTT